MAKKKKFIARIWWKNAAGELNTPVHSLSDRELMNELLAYLNKVEVSDNDREFHPNVISTCRVMDGNIIGQVLTEMEKRV